MKWRSLEETTGKPDVRSLAEQLAERKSLIRQYVLPQTQAVHDKVISDLKESGIEGRALAVGDKAPAFELPDQTGNLITSLALLTRAKLVVCFVRGRWCPFCVAQLEAMNNVLPQLRSAGSCVLAISPKTVQQSFFMAEQHKLRFPLLSDSGNRVARQFGLVYRVPEEQQAIYRHAFVNLPFANGDDSWELPIPATYVIDQDQTILFASANADYTTRPEPTELLQALVAGRLMNSTAHEDLNGAQAEQDHAD
jgi:peroxiredoxin